VESLLAFPYPGCDGYERFRLWYQEGKTGPKYKQRYGTGNRLYLPPTVDFGGDSSLLVVEGEKEALALVQAGYQVVGLGGVWNWCERAEGYRQPKEPRPISDLNRVNWRRPVTILFDSDGHDNRNVRLAAFRLARALAKCGAAVSILFLPAGENGEKVGVDDFLASHGPEMLREMLP
jgi:DNA primase